VIAVLLSVAPLAVLVGLLLLGRYPGERSLARARAAVATRRPRPQIRLRARVARRRGPAGPPRGGRLVAAAIASRPPPLVLPFLNP
jgi:hypothetical protein